MNYRHIYHAGNFADVFKHIALLLMLDYLKKKDKPFFVLDTHAGIGRYDLSSEQALKTREAEEGIGRLWDAHDLPEAAERYLGMVRRFNWGGGLKTYPGSPLMIKECLRPGDRFIANELHPEDVRALRQALGGDERVKVECMDGYAALKAFLPPPERRGLVLVDPPFEERNEFEALVEGVKQAHKRWATGMVALWYPIKDVKAVAAFHEGLKESGIPDIRAFDFYLRAVEDENALNGCGLVVVNAPWTMGEELGKIAGVLVERLTEELGRFEMREIAREA